MPTSRSRSTAFAALGAFAALAFAVWAGSFMLSRTSTPLERRIEPYPLGSRVITLTGAKGTIIARFDRYPNPPEYHVRLDGEPHKYHCLHTKIRLEPQ